MFYKAKLTALNSPWVRKGHRLALALTNRPSRADQHDKHIAGLVSEYTPNRSFADIGCMWGISGHFCFLAEESGARAVTGVDVMDPTDEFTNKVSNKNSRVRFVQGDFHDTEVQAKIGVSDVVLCSGVLYHVPNPLDTLLGLRKICGQFLILATAAIPEMDVKNTAVFWPCLDADQRRLWNRGIGTQVGITTPYDPDEGYGNWIWGLSPSAITSMLKIVGFSVEKSKVTQFGVVFVCRAQEVLFAPVGGKSESPLTDAFVEARLGDVNRGLWAQQKEKSS
jgi:ubiquinone/menaquinone biosynthesis C-methylase UbiE